MWAAVLTIFAVAVYLRFDGLAEPSLWLDEILHLEKALAARDEPWYTWLTGVSVDRENGPLYYASQLMALELFDGELGVRLMPVLTGLATVGALFLIGLSATGYWQAGAAAAALLAVSPLHVYYSREGRPYAAVMLTAALLLLFALEHRRPWTRAAVYALCIAAAYVGALAFPVLISCAVLATVAWLRSRRYGHFALAAVSGLAVGALLFSTVTREGRVIGTGEFAARWEITAPLSLVGLDRLLASLTVSGVDSGSAGGMSFVLLALSVWGGIRLARTEPQKALWVAGMCLLPIAGWLAALTAFGHWYNVRYTSAGLPAFLVLAGFGLVDLCRRLWKLIGRARSDRMSWVADALTAAVLILLVAPAWRTARAEPLAKPDWRGVAELIGRLASPDEPVIARDEWAGTCIRHYLSRSRRPVEVVTVNFDVDRAKRWTMRRPRGWVLAAGYRETADFEAWMRTLDPILSSRLANLELFFYPNFPAFLSEPARIEGLAALLEGRESATRQEFTHSELLLGAGWSYAEKSPDGTTFRWAMAERAEMALLRRPVGRKDGASALRLRLLPFPTTDRGAQSVEVAVNSRPLSRVTLEPGWNEISVPWTDGHSDGGPAADLVTFDFAWRQSPHEVDPSSPDTRKLAAAFDFVETVADPPGDAD